MADKKSMASLVLIPAVITLVVTVLRLVGELQGWSSTLFNKDAGGGGALIGIAWLVPIFGFYFGLHIRRSSRSVKLGRAAALYVLAAVVFIGGVAGLSELGLVNLPDPESDKEPSGFLYLFCTMGVAVLLCLLAWGRLTLTLMLYGLLARIPVIVITYLDLQGEWGTHYGAPAPGTPKMEMMDTFLLLSTAQLTFWPFLFTPGLGGLAGCLGAALVGKRS